VGMRSSRGYAIEDLAFNYSFPGALTLCEGGPVCARDIEAEVKANLVATPPDSFS
jgi:hypothetical protein